MQSEDRGVHNEFILENQLREYAANGLYPMHMPGHKRQQVGTQYGETACTPDGLTGAGAGLPYGWDVTEVPGTDDLHDAQGILREAMERTARLYGVARTWYLVNGSTCGLLAGIRAIAPYGSEVIVARNCHKAVYHAIELQDLAAHWVWPAWNDDYEIYGSIDPEAVATLLRQYPETAAVILTSPTYEGVVSDIRSIARICHEHGTERHPDGIPLLIDEAHGAHLGFREPFPPSAIYMGADIVVQSPHKTLPALTQTAWMHLPYDSLVEPESIERELDIFETSSPSYPLMASLDGCTGILLEHGEQMFADYVRRLEEILWPTTEMLHNLRMFGYGKCRFIDRPIYEWDWSKILICGRGCEIDGEGCTGALLADLLRKDYQIETEMHLGWNVLAMTSICDTDEGMQRLAWALLDLDQRATLSDQYEQAAVPCAEDMEHSPAAEVVMPIAEALRVPAEQVPGENVAGRIAAEYVYCYPPGIPVIVPGERITEDILRQLQTWELQGTTIHHSAMKRGYRVSID